MTEDPTLLLPDSTRPGSSGEGELLPSPSASGRLGAGPAEVFVTRLVEELGAAWRRGERPTAEEFLDRVRNLWDAPEPAIRWIYEEACLGRSVGQEVGLSELVRRFRQWRTDFEVLLAGAHLRETRPRPPVYPALGEALGDFLLLAELGRGARGRCLLAAQPSLAHRKVVLKVTANDQVEHLSLARLQHTHIMPLYSEHEFPALGLRALCMPYLGGTTLAQILVTVRAVPPDGRTGQTLLEILDRAEETRPLVQAGTSPARQFLARASYVRAVCWIGACLANALQYAHDRGLIHMDVKPSNVLLSADGQPMLLDFHLARDPIRPGETLIGCLGGTPGYMSPEQETMVRAIRAGLAVLQGVDARTDVYSLGLVLAEMLGARIPQPRGATPVRTDRFRLLPQVSPGLADLIRKCLEPEPGNRYPDAATLADDLRRHLADQPLRGIANRSWTERWRKWCRRQPGTVFRAKAVLAATITVGMVTALAWFAWLTPRLREAEHALLDGKIWMREPDYPEAVRSLTRGAALIEGLPGSGGLAEEFAAQLRRIHGWHRADRLHGLVERLRFLESASPGPPRVVREVERHCRALWDSRREVASELGEGPGSEIQRRLRTDLLDLAIIWAGLRVRLETDRNQVAQARREALQVLDEAEALFGPSHVLYRERLTHAEALGLSDAAEAARRGASRVPPRTAWEHYAVGRSRLASGDLVEAEAAFQQALALRPQDFWANFHQGVCAFRRGHYADAVTAFRVCVALAPDRAECFYDRALAQAALGHAGEASRDQAQAVRLDPTLAAPPFDRALTHHPEDR